MENNIICAYKPEEVYNVHPDAEVTEEEKNYRVICEINNTRYESIAEACRLTGESETRIRIKLKFKQDGYVIISKVPCNYEPIIANGKFYSSILEAVAAGEAKDKFQAMRRLKSAKYENWNYKNPAKYIDKSNKKSKKRK